MSLSKLLTILAITISLMYGCTNKDVARYNAEHQGNKTPQKQQQGITTNKITYSKLAYDELPADLQVMVNLQSKKGFTEVVKGKGDNQFVFIGLGERPTGGYSVNIESVEDVEGKISIVYSEQKPKPEDVVTQQITYPWLVIKIVSPLPVTKVTKQ